MPRRLPARADTWAVRRATVGGLALGVASGVNILNVGAVPDPLAGAYGVSLATVGLFTTALLVAHAAAQIPGGRAVDRFGARRMGLLLLAVGAAGNALIIAAAEPALVLGLRPLIGLSTGIGFRRHRLHPRGGRLVGNWVVGLLVRLGHSQGAAGAIGALTLALTVVSRPLGGWLLHRYAHRLGPALAASIVVGALGCAGLAAGGPVGAAVVAASAVGLGAGIAFAPVVTGTMRLRPDAPGAAVGAVNMWGNLVVLAATPLVGLAFSVPGGGRAAFLAVAALWAAALLALPGARELGVERPSAPAPHPAGSGIRSRR